MPEDAGVVLEEDVGGGDVDTRKGVKRVVAAVTAVVVAVAAAVDGLWSGERALRLALALPCVVILLVLLLPMAVVGEKAPAVMMRGSPETERKENMAIRITARTAYSPIR